MIDASDVENIKTTIEELLRKMTVVVLDTDVKVVENETPEDILNNQGAESKRNKDVIQVSTLVQDPQILIGQNGQTLFELERLVRIILSKKVQKDFYVVLDINDYKKKKNEYLKDLATTLANEVSLTKESKVLSPMSAYERRIIHAQLSQRQDVTTESHGEGVNRYIIIKSR